MITFYKCTYAELASCITILFIGPWKAIIAFFPHSKVLVWRPLYMRGELLWFLVCCVLVAALFLIRSVCTRRWWITILRTACTSTLGFYSLHGGCIAATVGADSAMLNLCHRSLITLAAAPQRTKRWARKHQICQADARQGISHTEHYVEARTDCFPARNSWIVIQLERKLWAARFETKLESLCLA